MNEREAREVLGVSHGEWVEFKREQKRRDREVVYRALVEELMQMLQSGSKEERAAIVRIDEAVYRQLEGDEELMRRWVQDRAESW
jgi:hypothetical protein